MEKKRSVGLRILGIYFIIIFLFFCLRLHHLREFYLLFLHIRYSKIDLRVIAGTLRIMALISLLISGLFIFRLKSWAYHLSICSCIALFILNSFIRIDIRHGFGLTFALFVIFIQLIFFILPVYCLTRPKVKEQFVKIKLLLSLVIISTITVPCFSENNRAIEKSKNFYGNLDSYKASFTSQFYGQGENKIKGKIYYKHPNLLRIEAKQLLFGDERKMLIILDGSHYYNEIVTTAKADTEIRKADGRIVHIKKGELEISVMLFRKDLQDISMEILKKTLKELEKEDLAWYLLSFQPGGYSKNPHFPFDIFTEYYSLKNSAENHFEAELTNSSDVNTLPLLVKCYFNESGMITKIETLDKDNQKKAEISYENLKINPTIKDSLFNYTIPDNAFVIDHVADIKHLYTLTTKAWLMKTFLYLISSFWILVGIAAIISPLKLKTLYTSLIKPAKALFILPLIAGALLLWAHPASSLKPLISVLAVISFLKAIFLFVCPQDALKSFLNRILSLPLVFYRVEGVFIVGLGVVVGWSVW